MQAVEIFMRKSMMPIALNFSLKQLLFVLSDVGMLFVSGKIRNGMFRNRSLLYLFAPREQSKGIRSAMTCHRGILKAKILFIFRKQNHTMAPQLSGLVYACLVSLFILIQ